MTKKKEMKAPLSLIKLSKQLLITTILIILLLFGSSIAAYFYLIDRIYPGISVGEINISLLTRYEAKERLTTELRNRSSKTLILHANSQSFEIKVSEESIVVNIDGALDEAFKYGHTEAYYPPKRITLKISPDIPLSNQLKQIASSVNQPPIDSTLKVDGDQINVTPSQEGLILDEEAVALYIESLVNGGGTTSYNLPLKKASPKLSYESALEIKKRLDEIKISPLKLAFKDQTFTLSLDQLIELIDLESSNFSLLSAQFTGKPVTITSVTVNGQEVTDTKLSLDQEKTITYLKSLAKQIDQPVEEPLFNFDPQSPTRVKEFRPPQEGRHLNIEKSAANITSVLQLSGENQVDLVVDIISPQNKLTNELGIKELIGQGTSNFAGSIENRIYNLKLAASRINGVLVKPGEVFSFVNTVGDITAATGYKQAYVIKSGRTVLDDGGGVCQVSTTLFRAALNSGLPVVTRTAHAYRVGYYEQGYPPGLDATIFYPSVDFKFKNDTEKSILIQAYSSGYYLYVDFYGTSDGRIATVSKPIITNATPPPAELRQDDPSLPKGTVKQVDWPAWGANVVFSRTVTKDGKTIINESFRSNYRPWQAVYLVGTGG